MAEDPEDPDAPARSGSVKRRALIAGGIAGGAVTALGAGGLAAQDTLRRWWWRLSGSDVPREQGEVDHPGAEWVPASEANYRHANRPRDYAIDRVVIHMPEATYEVTLQVFQDPSHGAASHYVIRSSDGHIAQMARELDVAYHAGNWDYNLRSIGIEHEGWADDPSYLTDVMYESSAELVAGICRRYHIPVDREHILGHNEVPDVARICPGPHWDWDRYMGLLRRASRRQAAG
ncbi:N-acetylmuramoyl-L-alanine amidase [Streptomyces sp. 7-21]|jgi:N-acetyl-anhydromuramyl-L-alanine amidase AmpD|uniref:N-acetylmuramoyl-L-alanine amidase n=1 Tax=Streptomyces sp. 7-21 TaxID=2802283 RepID=UPI00191CEFCA|nr:N-acetylmuramoyl-L-alanine amidase [Streptomyces sp. 7-21]MBL1065429.1 N-acetylmuramoyl-L-alanine amidase [Streptomyces sp. 7-21]